MQNQNQYPISAAQMACYHERARTERSRAIRDFFRWISATIHQRKEGQKILEVAARRFSGQQAS